METLKWVLKGERRLLRAALPHERNYFLAFWEGPALRPMPFVRIAPGVGPQEHFVLRSMPIIRRGFVNER